MCFGNFEGNGDQCIYREINWYDFGMIIAIAVHGSYNSFATGDD